MTVRSGDGSNAPISAVSDILSEHLGSPQPVETPQEETLVEQEALTSDPEPEEVLEEELPEEEEEERKLEAAEDDDITTVAQLAEAFGVEPAALYGLEFSMPDGMEPVTLSELKDTYIELKRNGAPQGNQEVEQIKAELQSEKQQLQQQQQQLQQQQQVPQELRNLEARMQNIQQAMQNTNWAELEQIDAGDAALQRQKLMEAMNNIGYQYQTRMREFQQQQQQQQQQFLSEQIRVIENAHPEWKGNRDELAQAYKDIVKHGSSYGLTEKDFSMIPDGRVFNMLYDASQLLKAAKQPVKGQKLSRKSAPALKAGAIRRAVKQKSSKLDGIIKQGTESRDIRDKTAAVSALLNS